jgi:pimeloyl-ACP methyl ester carboxylesterase
MIDIYEDDRLKISVVENTEADKADSVILSFTGLGHRVEDTHIQKPEFYGTGRAFAATVFITDKTRSWGNALDFDVITKLIAPYIKGRKIFTIGNSMGGFNAILAGHYFPVEACVAFAPQFSVDRRVVPWEDRWSKAIARIKSFDVGVISDFMNDTTRYYLFSGGRGLDYFHAALFPKGPNIFHYRFNRLGHHLSGKLKKRGALDDLIRGCFEGDVIMPKGQPAEVLSPVRLRREQKQRMRLARASGRRAGAAQAG